MATKIRLTRLGKKKQATYRVVVIDSRKPRDGKYIEQLGFYDPRQNPSIVKIDNERALHWLHTGAQPTERAKKLLEISGAWTMFRVARGDIHTVGTDTAESDTATEETPEPAIEAVVESVQDENVAEVVEEAAEVADEAANDSSDES